MIRMKVSRTGIIVIHKPDPYPATPWFVICGPKPTLFESGGLKAFFADDEVKDWADWGPIDSPRAVPQEFTETVMVAKDIKAGMQVMYRGSWEPVKEASYRDAMQRLLWLGERKRPITFTPYEPLAVRLNKEDGK